MHTTRREFMERFALGAAAIGGLPASLDRFDPAHIWTSTGTADEWDVTWPKRLSAKHRAVFDVPEVDSGYGVWRASIWVHQYNEVLGIPTSDMSTAIVLRHNGIVLAMTQPFWDAYGIGKLKNALHPVTQQLTDRNPALLSAARNEIPPEYDPLSLDKAIARGTVVLACNLALRDCVDLVQKKDGISAEAARTKAVGYLVPGVILQPSGVFAAVRAQQAGCAYVRAS